MRKTLLVLTLFVAGCALSPKVAGDGNSVTITLGTGQNREDATLAASRYCADEGKRAEFAGNVSEFRIAYVYRCVQ